MVTELLVTGVGEIMKKVCSSAADEINAAWGVKGELQRLKRKLSMIQSVINDAEKRQEGNEAVKRWLQTLKGIAYDAEDVIDDSKPVLFRLTMEMQTLKSKVRNFFFLTNPIVFHFKIAHKIKFVNRSVNLNLMSHLTIKIREGDIFGFIEVNHSHEHHTVSDRQVTTSCVNTSAIVGRNVEKMSEVDQLLKSSDQDHVGISVLPIVGVGGLGKTTLAQLVYGNDEIKKSFDIKRWICVSEVFDVQRILREITEFITKSKCDLSNMDVMVSDIQENLRGKRFLLVLDDVWNEEPDKWETFKNLLGGAGVITRSEKVSSLVGTLNTHYLQKLSQETSWRLFEQLVFIGGRAPENSNLTEIGIARKCGGVHLALVLLGGVMRIKKPEREWLHMRDSELWLHPESHKLMRILKLRNDCLSQPLQGGFSYCAIFPKDAVIDKKVLVQLWMAEGLLQQPKSGCLSTEGIGDEYWNMLRQNSFFQDINEEKFLCSFKMHDLVHDLARSLARKEWCFENVDRNEVDSEIRFMVSGSDLLESLPSTNKLLGWNTQDSLMFPLRCRTVGS